MPRRRDLTPLTTRPYVGIMERNWTFSLLSRLYLLSGFHDCLEVSVNSWHYNEHHILSLPLAVGVQKNELNYVAWWQS